EQRRRGVDAVEHVRLRASGLRLVYDLDGGRPAVGARILHGDAGIGLAERLDQRAHRLVHDQRRVPDDFAFLLGGLVERGVGGVGRGGRRQRDGQGQATRSADASIAHDRILWLFRIPARLALLAEARDAFDRLRGLAVVWRPVGDDLREAR